MACFHHVLQEQFVFRTMRELPTASQQNGLIHRGFEVSVRRLRIAVFLGRTHIRSLTRHAVVSQQILIPRLKLPLRGMIVHRRREVVRAVRRRYTAQFPEGVLQPFTQGLKRLRRADRDRFPVRVGEHEVIHEVLERLTRDGDFPCIPTGEVRRGDLPGVMHLTEEHGLVRPVFRAPFADASFETATL